MLITSSSIGNQKDKEGSDPAKILARMEAGISAQVRKAGENKLISQAS